MRYHNVLAKRIQKAFKKYLKRKQEKKAAPFSKIRRASNMAAVRLAIKLPHMLSVLLQEDVNYCVVFFLLMHENHFPPFNSFTGCGGQDTAETTRYDGTRPGRPAPAELTGESIWALRGIFTLF